MIFGPDEAQRDDEPNVLGTLLGAHAASGALASCRRRGHHPRASPFASPLNRELLESEDLAICGYPPSLERAKIISFVIQAGR